MLDLPTYAYPFILAVIAAFAAWWFAGPVGDDAGSFPGWILYAVAIGCVVIGIATWWLSTTI